MPRAVCCCWWASKAFNCYNSDNSSISNSSRGSHLGFTSARKASFSFPAPAIMQILRNKMTSGTNECRSSQFYNTVAHIWQALKWAIKRATFHFATHSKWNSKIDYVAPTDAIKTFAHLQETDSPFSTSRTRQNINVSVLFSRAYLIQ